MTDIFLAFDGPAFDKAVHGGMPDAGDLQIIVKEEATIGGNPAVCLTFTSQLPTGELRGSQTVTTLRCLLAVLKTLDAKYPNPF